MIRALVLLFVAGAVCAQPIHRDPRVVREFRKSVPCPSTGRTRGACPGFQADHSRSLCSGGEDRPENLTWLSVEDHKWKTFIDNRECRKLRRLANTPAIER